VEINNSVISSSVVVNNCDQFRSGVSRVRGHIENDSLQTYRRKDFVCNSIVGNKNIIVHFTRQRQSRDSKKSTYHSLSHL